MKPNKPPVIDFHGRTGDEVFDLLDLFIRKHKNQMKIVVIVGKGGQGVIKQKVVEYLKMAHYSWIHEKLRGHINEGALIVNLH